MPNWLKLSACWPFGEAQALSTLSSLLLFLNYFFLLIFLLEREEKRGKIEIET